MFDLTKKAAGSIRGDMFRMAKQYVDEVGDALKVIRGLESLMVMPLIEFDSRLHLKIEFGNGDTLLDGNRIVVIYSYADKKPIYAYLKENEYKD